MLGSAARKERKERKKREKKAGGGGGASKSSSSVVSSSQGTHDSAQTLTNDKTPISPIPEAATPQSKAKNSAEAMNTSGDSTTTASTAAATTAADKKKKKKSKDTPSEEEESLLQKRWFRLLAGAACSIAAVSTGTKLWMRKEENVQVKKEDVATPAAAGAKKKRGN